MDRHAHLDTQVTRARVLLGFMSKAEAIQALVESGLSKGDAFLAVCAAQVLDKPVSRETLAGHKP